MARYFFTGSLASGGAAYFSAIETALTAAGWTLHDAVSSTHHVWQPPDVAAGVYFFLDLANVGSIGLHACIDWDSSTHTALLPSGSATGGGFATPGGTAYIYANALGLTMAVIDGTFNHWIWVGQPRVRSLQGQTDGICLSTAGMSAAATTVAVDRDLTGRLFVGQKVAIQNFAHNSASGNASNTELVTITAVGSSSLSFTATSNAYDSGAKIGPPDMLWPLGMSPANINTWTSGALAPSLQAVGQRTLAAAGAGSGIGLTPGFLNSGGTPTALNNATVFALGTTEAFVPFLISPSSSDAGFGQPAFGLVLSMTPVSGGAPAAGTKYTDGTDVFIQVSGSNSVNPLVLFGPTGDTPDFGTQTRILPPTIAVSDSIYTFVPAAGSAPTNALNQGLT